MTSKLFIKNFISCPASLEELKKNCFHNFILKTFFYQSDNSGIHYKTNFVQNILGEIKIKEKKREKLLTFPRQADFTLKNNDFAIP